MKGSRESRFDRSGYLVICVIGMGRSWSEVQCSVSGSDGGRQSKNGSDGNITVSAVTATYITVSAAQCELLVTIERAHFSHQRTAQHQNMFRQ